MDDRDIELAHLREMIKCLSKAVDNLTRAHKLECERNISRNNVLNDKDNALNIGEYNGGICKSSKSSET